MENKPVACSSWHLVRAVVTKTAGASLLDAAWCSWAPSSPACVGEQHPAAPHYERSVSRPRQRPPSTARLQAGDPCSGPPSYMGTTNWAPEGTIPALPRNLLGEGLSHCLGGCSQTAWARIPVILSRTSCVTSGTSTSAPRWPLCGNEDHRGVFLAGRLCGSREQTLCCSGQPKCSATIRCRVASTSTRQARSGNATSPRTRIS